MNMKLKCGFLRKCIRRGLLRKWIRCGFLRKCAEKRPSLGRVATFLAAALLSLLLLACVTQNLSVPAECEAESLACSVYDEPSPKAPEFEMTEAAEQTETTEPVQTEAAEQPAQTEPESPVQTEPIQPTREVPRNGVPDRPTEPAPTEAASVYTPMIPGMMEHTEDEDWDGETPEDLILYEYWNDSWNTAGATDEVLWDEEP